MRRWLQWGVAAVSVLLSASPVGAVPITVSTHLDFSPVPEPSTLALFGMALLALGFLRKHRHSTQ